MILFLDKTRAITKSDKYLPPFLTPTPAPFQAISLCNFLEQLQDGEIAW